MDAVAIVLFGMAFAVWLMAANSPKLKNHESCQTEGDERKTMERVCAWCKKSMGTLEVSAKTTMDVTHGICPECNQVVKEEIERAKKEQNENQA